MSTLSMVVMATALLWVAAPAVGQLDETVGESLMCGTNIVNVGDTEFEVLDKCGAPTARDDGRWTYDFGPGSFLKILTFVDGVLQSVQDGNRQQ